MVLQCQQIFTNINKHLFHEMHDQSTLWVKKHIISDCMENKLSMNSHLNYRTHTTDTFEVFGQNYTAISYPTFSLCLCQLTTTDSYTSHRLNSLGTGHQHGLRHSPSEVVNSLETPLTTHSTDSADVVMVRKLKFLRKLSPSFQ